MTYTVKAVADMASITVRAVHHYDRIGLLRPSSFSPAGYRLYSDADLERLQQVLFFRELGFSLNQIKGIVTSPGFDRKEALTTHRELLLRKRERLDTLIGSVDRTIESIERGDSMDGKSMFEGLDDSQMDEYREEARQRWGSEKVDESYRRLAKYTREERDAMMAEQEEIESAMASLVGRSPSDPEVQHWVDRHFRRINDRFYECNLDMYRGLGDLYVDDPRFTEHFEQREQGLAGFMREAISAYCDREATRG